jgi:hypothetical protein
VTVVPTPAAVSAQLLNAGFVSPMFSVFLRSHSAVAPRSNRFIAVRMKPGAAETASEALRAVLGPRVALRVSGAAGEFTVFSLSVPRPGAEHPGALRVMERLLSRPSVSATSPVFASGNSQRVIAAGLWVRFTGAATESQRSSELARVTGFGSPVTLSDGSVFLPLASGDMGRALSAARLLARSPHVAGAVPHQDTVAATR